MDDKVKAEYDKLIDGIEQLISEAEQRITALKKGEQTQ